MEMDTRRLGDVLRLAVVGRVGRGRAGRPAARQAGQVADAG